MSLVISSHDSSQEIFLKSTLLCRAGNEKDEDQADTVGCCSLRVEHITLHGEKDGKPFVVEFDFLGKDSIRYNNAVPVEKRVYKNVTLFMENKKVSQTQSQTCFRVVNPLNGSPFLSSKD